MNSKLVLGWLCSEVGKVMYNKYMTK